MSQRNIDYGGFPNDPNSDAIRTAFQKVQLNFTELFNAGGVSSVNKIPQPGLTVSPTTGAVLITANIACVQVHTSTLSIGRNANGSQDTSITQSSQVLWVDLPANIANVANINLSGYANVVGNVTAGNLISTNLNVSATSNLGGVNNVKITGGTNGYFLQTDGTGNLTWNLGTSTPGTGIPGGANSQIQYNKGDGNFAGTSGFTFNSVTSNVNAPGNIVAVANVIGGNLIAVGGIFSIGNANVGNLSTPGLIVATGNVTGGNLITTGVVSSPSILNGTSNVRLASSGNVSISVGGTSNVVVVTTTGANIAGTANIIGNANVGNLEVIGTANVGSDLEVIGTANVGGNLEVIGTANVGNLGTSGLIIATGNITGANITTTGRVTATGNITGGNLVTTGVLSVTGNANVGNLGVTGLVLSTGNVTGGNLITAGRLSATGNANVGNLGTSGLIVATGNITGGNLVSTGNLSISGNASAGNLTTATVVATTGNITSKLLLTGSENLANGAAANLSLITSYFSTTGVSTATLAAGTAGQIKTFMMVDDGGDMTITVTNAGWKTSGIGTLTFNSIGDGCTLQYVASKWFCIGNNGVVLA
jgi:filamentous hemagglutinin